MKALKVCMINPHFPPEFGWHGPGRDSMELAIEVAQRGHEVDVIACSEKMGQCETFQDGIRVIRIKWQKEGRQNSLIAHSLPRARMLLNLNLALWQAFLQASRNRRYDIVDVSGFSAESLVPSILADCPVISRPHNGAPAFWDEELAMLGKSGFRFEQYIADSLQSIAVNCSNTLGTMGEERRADKDGEDERITNTNYSLDTSTFSPRGLLAVDTEGRPSLLIHTSIEKDKYKALLVEIVNNIKKEVPNLWLSIIASDVYSESSESALKENLAELGVRCDLVINQKMSRGVMPGLWRNSSCGLIMDWQKFAPYAVLEPLSCAVPIVAECDSADMHFLKDPTVVVKPEQFNAEQVAEKLIELLKDERLRKDLGEKARLYILANHCRKANGEKTIKTYEKAIQEFGDTQQAMKIQTLEKVLQQCSALSDRLDEWLYDFLFVRSLRFRLSHWLKKLK